MSAKMVEDAAVMTMLPVPSKETPLIVRAVWSLVAVPALPEMEPVIKFVNVSFPEKPLLSESKVDDAAVPPPQAAPVEVS